VDRSRGGALDLVALVAIAGFVIWVYERLGGKNGASRPATQGANGGSLHLSRALADAASTGLHVLAILLTLAVVVLLGLVLSRLYWRYQRARRTVLREIVLSPDDVATPFEIMSALDAIHMTLLTRYAGAAYGQDYWTFEIIRDADGVVHFVIGAHELRISRVEQALRAKYQNIRFQPYARGYEPTYRYPQQLALNKPWWVATETQRDYTNSIVETVVQSLDAADGPVHLQFHMTPLEMGVYHQRLQSYIRSREYALRSEQAVDPASQGVGYVEDKQQKNSLQLMGKGVYRTEIRLGANTWADGQSVIGALGEANDENSFKAFLVIAGRSIWHAWLRARMPSLYLFRWNVMFTFPLATLIHLPSNRLRVNSLVRRLVRRQPAPKSVPRFDDISEGIVLDEESRIPVGIPEVDRMGNIGIFGAQGTGKTTDLLNIFRQDASWKDPSGLQKAVVLIDIGKDTSKRALGLVPPGREVLYFAPGDPTCGWTVNPLQASSPDSVVADNVLAAMTQVFGEQAIQSRSREFLGNAVMALREVMGAQADFKSMYRLLTDEGFRVWIGSQVKDQHQAEFWQHTLPDAAAADPRYLTDGLAAPRNKLDELLRNPLIRSVLDASTGRKMLDMGDVLKRRAILVVNLDKAKLGDAGARLLGIIIIQLLWDALQRQNEMEEKSRATCSLILDESQNYVADGFLDLLAEGRAYGLQTTLAIRFLGEMASQKVIQGLHVLVQNVIIHQFQLLDEAEDFMKLMMRIYANMVQTNAEVQDQLNFGVDDITRLPRYKNICLWMVNGSVQQPFLGETINWEPFYRDEWRLAHLSEQPIASGENGQPSLSPTMHDVATAAVRTKPAASGASSDGASPIETATGELQKRRRDDGVPVDRSEVDPVTGLGGRAGIERVIADATELSAVAFIDCDGLKEANDSLGHAAGDALLRRAADAIRSAVREGDFAGRHGGDEYVVIMPGFTEEQRDAWMGRVRSAFEAHAVQASVGLAIQEPGESLAATLERADKLMYEDKRQRKTGRNAVGLSVDALAVVYRLATERQVSVASLMNAIKSTEASEADVTNTCLWMLDHSSLPKSRLLPVFKASLNEAVKARTLRTAKAFTCEKLGISRPRLEALLHGAGISDDDFPERARAFWTANRGRKPTEVEFRLAMAGESAETPPSVDLGALASKLGGTSENLAHVIEEEGIPIQDLEDLVGDLLAAQGGHGTLNELRLAWRRRGRSQAKAVSR